MSDNQIGTIVVGLGTTVLFHPLTYFKTLAQLGYEPLAPIQGLSRPWPFGGQMIWFYPNGFQYLKHIREEDGGFFAMYRGLGPRLCSGLIASVTAKNLTVLIEENGLKREEALETDTEQEAWLKLGRKVVVESIAQSAAVIASYPFHVIMVRQMAQFIGKEHIYDNSLYSFSEIYNNEGIAGFFGGLVPRLLGEVLTITLANTLIFVVKRYIPRDKEDSVSTSMYKAICSLVASAATYPLMAVSTVMIVNRAPGLVAAVEPLGRVKFEDWQQALRYLHKRGASSRGNSLFRRKCVMTQID